MLFRSGLLVHRSNLDRHETRYAVQELRDQLGCRVHPVHRLDKGTSGVLLFALDAGTARRIGSDFAAQRVSKRYLAVVRGWPAEGGEIDHPLTRQFDDYGRKYPPDSLQRQAAALPARTTYQRLATVELPLAVDRYPATRYALVALQPHSGRSHQLRRHMKHIAHPIIGDATFGKGVHNRFFQQHFGCGRLLLACTQLGFTHPATGVQQVIDAPLAPGFSRLLQAMGWEIPPHSPAPPAHP